VWKLGETTIAALGTGLLQSFKRPFKGPVKIAFPMISNDFPYGPGSTFNDSEAFRR
jgi:hypothetical protein